MTGVLHIFTYLVLFGKSSIPETGNLLRKVLNYSKYRKLLPENIFQITLKYCLKSQVLLAIVYSCLLASEINYCSLPACKTHQFDSASYSFCLDLLPISEIIWPLTYIRVLTRFSGDLKTRLRDPVMEKSFRSE